MNNSELERILNCIRKHRDQRLDDRCWLDDIELYRSALPEGVAEADLRLLSPCEMITNCARYIAHRHDPTLEYTSSQREVERLEAEIEKLKAEVQDVLEKGYCSGYGDAQYGEPYEVRIVEKYFEE